MKAYLINPYDRTVTEVHRDAWPNEAMHEALSAPDHKVDCICRVAISRTESIWVDDNGFLTPGRKVWRLAGYCHPLAGKGLCLGLDGAGDNAEPGYLIETIKSYVIWTDHVSTGEMAGAGPTEYGYTMGTPVTRPEGL